MNSSNKTKISQYENFIRDIANDVVAKINLEKLDKKGQSFLSKTQERFCFDNENGWKFFTSALDTIGDSDYAITTYLDSNSHGSNFGVQYLNIYGVLSAIYIQQQSIIKLLELFKVNNLNLKIKEFTDLEITNLRHCISAHPINYSIENKKTSFKIVRSSFIQRGKIEICDQANNFTTYDVHNLINEYKEVAEKLIFVVAEKMINNTYKSSKDKVRELKTTLCSIQTVDN